MRQESETKLRLLQTALDLIWENSYGTIGVEDICRRAGVLKGSFYHFFPSKSDLAVAAIDRYWEDIRRPQMDRLFSVQMDPLERFAAYCDNLYDLQKARAKKFGKVCGCPFSSIGSELSTRDEKVRRKSQELGGRVCRYFESTLRDGQRMGLFPLENVTAKAQELYSYVTGVLLQARIHNDAERVKSIPAGFWLLLGAARPAPGRLYFNKQLTA
jgi:TetR/AcrR family transcriptional regulator, transcriptional repressor for nem operon